MSSAMLTKTKNSDLPEWKSPTTYDEIYRKMKSLRTYLENNEGDLDTLTVREKTFLRWQLRSIEGMLFCTSDTEEETPSNDSSEGTSRSPKEMVEIVKEKPRRPQNVPGVDIDFEEIFTWDE